MLPLVRAMESTWSDVRAKFSSAAYTASVAIGLGANRLPFAFPYPHSLESMMTRTDWLLGTLRLCGFIPFHAVVDEVKVEPFRRSESLKSSMGRVIVTWYDADGEEHRKSALVKFSPVDSDFRSEFVYTWQRVNVREVVFYDQLAPLVPIRVPGCYHAEATPYTGRMCLILEEFEDVHEVDESIGASHEETLAVIETMAKLHAAFWGVPQNEVRASWPTTHRPLGGHPYLPQVMDSLVWPEAPETFHTIWQRTWRAALADPLTLLHGDLRVGNVLFQEGQDPIFIDWQASRLGQGALDLAFFLTLSVPTELRREHQDAYLEHYLAVLRDNGVLDYSAERLFEHYRLGQLYTLLLLALPQLSKEVNVHDENKEMAERIADAWRDRLREYTEEMDHQWIADEYDLDVDDVREVMAFRDDREPAQ